jgi:hypothetical protein
MLLETGWKMLSNSPEQQGGTAVSSQAAKGHVPTKGTSLGVFQTSQECSSKYSSGFDIHRVGGEGRGHCGELSSDISPDGKFFREAP